MYSYTSLGLNTAAERAALDNTLVSSYSLKVEILVMDLAGKVKSDLSARLVDGQVNIDASAEITRSASLTLYDPNGSIAFDSDSPNDSAMYLHNMIRINYCVKGPLLDWVTIPIFTGPITSLSRTDKEISVECQGKELLAQGYNWSAFNRPKGAYVVNVIRDLLKERTGESKFDFPEDPNRRLAKPFTLKRGGNAWAAAKSLAKTLNKQLFYDGSGRLVLRSISSHPQWEFTTGDGGDVLSIPELSFSTDDIKNTVIVNGGAPKGKKAKITATAILVDSHPLSPQRMGRNGVPRHLVEVIDNPQIRSAKNAKDTADDHLARLVRQEVDVSFDAVPIPMLEEQDVCSVKTDEAHVEFHANQFTIPLVAGGAMSMGYLHKTSFAHNRFRNKAKWIKPKKPAKKASGKHK